MELKELRNQIDQVDKEMAQLFEKRMELVKKVGEYKKAHHLPILDEKREKEVILKNSSYLTNSEILPLYHDFLTHLMNLAKRNEK